MYACKCLFVCLFYVCVCEAVYVCMMRAEIDDDMMMDVSINFTSDLPDIDCDTTNTPYNKYKSKL